MAAKATATTASEPTPPASWHEDLAPIGDTDWCQARARHLLDRAGFGGTPEEIGQLAGMSPGAAVSRLVDYHAIDNTHLQPFDHSGIWDPTLEPFPPSRPAATRLAERTGKSMGIDAKPAGTRRLQPVCDRFFYWLRGSLLETRRVANWWADRMVATNRPLEEKMALFWHGHFASGEDKVRDYRKLHVQLTLFQRHATGNFRDLLIGVAKDPAMLVFLDAGENVKGRPNENFGREVMELFTMGVGHYTEQDIREGARAFTGWRYRDLAFYFDPTQHDDGVKTFLGRTGRFDGEQVLDIILDQKVTAEFIAAKLYRFLVRDDISPEFQTRLGALLRDHNYEIAPFLRTVFLSRDFYSAAAVGTHIKGPVELIVATYRRLGLKNLPGVPDFYASAAGLGQALLNPPTVAGWGQGRAWITPGTLLARGNFARDVVMPDMIDFVDPNLIPYAQDRRVNRRIRAGQDITTATSERGAGMMAAAGTGQGMAHKNEAMANLLSAHEEFNTHYGSYQGWVEAVRKVKPIPRAAAQFSLTDTVSADGAKTTAQAVDRLLARFIAVPVDDGPRAAMIAFLDEQLGTTELERARTYSEEPLRMLAHLIMSLPEYQLA